MRTNLKQTISTLLSSASIRTKQVRADSPSSAQKIHKTLTPEQQKILVKVEQCYLLAESHLQRTFVRPEVSFNLRGKSAGTAHLNTHKLRFNPILLRENFDVFLDEVVTHEICHLLTFDLYGKVRPHGKEWQALMLAIFNITPNTTHNLDTSSVTGKQFDYHCHCGLVKLSIRRHNKVKRGETQYRCRRCQQQLQPTPHL